MNLTPAIEKASVAEIKKFQEQKLREVLTYVQTRSPFYQRHFANNGIDIGGIRSLEDLQQIPPTTKDDLQQGNWDFL